jgi:hypothetical protein
MDEVDEEEDELDDRKISMVQQMISSHNELHSQK